MTDAPTVGHNAPPDPLLAEAAERTEAANRWLTERPDVAQWDAEIADKANFFMSQVDATFKALDRRRIDEKNVFLVEQDKVYKTPLSLLDRAKAKLGELRRAWLRREEDRLAEEARKRAEAAAEAERLAEDARKKAEAEAKKKRGNVLEAELAAEEAALKAEQAREAAAAPPEKAVIKGSFSPRASGLRDVWSADVVDISAAFKHYNAKSNPYRSRLATAIAECIKGIADSEARIVKDETKAPPGVKFIKERK